MVVGARRAGLSISKTANLLVFSHTTISRVYRKWSKKEKMKNALLMSEVRGEWADWLEMIERQQNTISECTTRRTLKQMGHNSRKPHRVPLLSAKNRKRRLQFTQAHQNWTIEDWKTLPGLMNPDFCCDIQMVGSEFGVKKMKARIHPALSQRFRLVVVV